MKEEQMEHSKAYEDFIKFYNATGMERIYGGYDKKMLEKIYDWERDEVEDLIWEGFKKDKFLVDFLPELKKYDGLKVVEETLEQMSIPNYNSVEFAVVLYEHTRDEKFIDMIAKNIHMDPKEGAYVIKLSKCTPCSAIYNYLTEIYINNEDSGIRLQAQKGMLYNKGIIDIC